MNPSIKAKAYLLVAVLVLVQCAAHATSDQVAFSSDTRLETWSEAGRCGVILTDSSTKLKLVTDVNYPCRARERRDRSVMNYPVEGAEAVFLLCGHIKNRNVESDSGQKPFYEGRGFQAVVVKNGAVFLSRVVNEYCAPHNFEAPHHAILASSDLTQVKPIEFKKHHNQN